MWNARVLSIKVALKDPGCFVIIQSIFSPPVYQKSRYSGDRNPSQENYNLHAYKLFFLQKKDSTSMHFSWHGVEYCLHNL